jgi:SAM-dependent methyltransferase
VSGLATRWNRLRYTAWSVGYDAVVGFSRQRSRSLALLALAPGERVLIVGAGTGADLPLLPAGVEVLATDLTPAMLARARARVARLPSMKIDLRVMDGQALDLPDAAYDAVVLHLILAVIPDPVACLREAARVLRPGGRIAVFDKFLAAGARPSLPRRLLNAPARLLATDINRVLEQIVAASGASLAVTHDEPAGLGGAFRIVQLRKRDVAARGIVAAPGAAAGGAPHAGTAAPPEVWLRGPVPGIPAPLQPVAHALLQVREELAGVLADLPADVVWERPAGAAAIGFHALHLAGSTDRLFTYARGESLSETQRAALAAEKEPPREPAAELLRRVESAVDAALAQLAATDPSTLGAARAVGRAGLPSTVGGLLFHAAEHAQRHAGQIATTARILRGSQPNREE